MEIISQIIRLNAGKCRRNRHQNVFKIRGLKHTQNDVTRAYLIRRIQQRTPNPRAFHHILKVRGQIADRAGTTWQGIKSRGHFSRDLTRIQFVVFHNLVNIAVLIVQYLMNPVDYFNVWVAPHFAKHGGPFYGFVPQCVELSKKRDSADLCHGFLSLDCVRRIVLNAGFYIQFICVLFCFFITNPAGLTQPHCFA